MCGSSSFCIPFSTGRISQITAHFLHFKTAKILQFRTIYSLGNGWAVGMVSTARWVKVYATSWVPYTGTSLSNLMARFSQNPTAFTTPKGSVLIPTASIRSHDPKKWQKEIHIHFNIQRDILSFVFLAYAASTLIFLYAFLQDLRARLRICGILTRKCIPLK